MDVECYTTIPQVWLFAACSYCTTSLNMPLYDNAMRGQLIKYARFNSVCQKCAKALALLPKAHGDATTWSSLLRRILIATNSELDFAFAGMEDGG